jgi:phosphatidate phosphatase PAH1
MSEQGQIGLMGMVDRVSRVKMSMQGNYLKSNRFVYNLFPPISLAPLTLCVQFTLTPKSLFWTTSHLI